MLDANLGATERVLDAAATVGMARVVYVSTNNVHGNTHGQIVDEGRSERQAGDRRDGARDPGHLERRHAAEHGLLDDDGGGIREGGNDAQPCSPACCDAVL